MHVYTCVCMCVYVCTYMHVYIFFLQRIYLYLGIVIIQCVVGKLFQFYKVAKTAFSII